MLRILTALSVVAGLALALNVSTAGAQFAGSAVTVSVRALGCADASGQNCDRPLAGVGYTIAEAGQDNGVGATTGADGAATLSLPVPDDAETIAVVVVGAMPAGYASYSVSCVDPETGAGVPVQSSDGGIALQAEPGDLIACEWSYLPASDPGDADGSLTIRKFACPAGFDGRSFERCRANPLAGVGFTVFRAGTDNGVGATTDANGAAGFPLFAADLPGDVGIHEDVPDGYAGFQVSCADAGGQPVNYVPGDTGITLLGVEDGARITCEWFNVPADDGSADPTSTPTPIPPARDGARARPASIRAGACDDLGDEVARLTGPRVPTGEAVGAEDAKPAATSFTTVDAPLDDLVAADHAIAVLRSAAEGEPVACGAIGGVVAEDGSLAVAVSEEGGSGVAGVAYLVPNAADPGRTDVSLLLDDPGLRDGGGAEDDADD